jgi:MarC family membrane protein
MEVQELAWNEFVGITMLLYGLINPIGVIPIYLHLLHQTAEVRVHRVISLASVVVACLLIATAVFGRQILGFFNVGIDDFRIAGGLLALFIAFEMFQARYGGFMQTIEERREAETDLHSIAITPLAFPLLVGPAEMSVMITLSNEATYTIGQEWLVAVVLFTTLLMAVTLWMAKSINRFLGTTGINVVTRVMALIVASIGIKFILTGLKNALPGLAH